MGDDDWGSLMPSPAEGWGEGVAPPVEGWGESRTVATARPARTQPLRRDDDPDAAKTVDGLAAKVLAGKKKMATVRAQMNEIDAKRQALEVEIDALMPVLQELRAKKGAVMGQLQAGRLPAIWTEKARELNSRRRREKGRLNPPAALLVASASALPSPGELGLVRVLFNTLRLLLSPAFTGASLLPPFSEDARNMSVFSPASSLPLHRG